MSVLPGGIADLLEFCEAHVPAWSAAPASLGLSVQQVGVMSALTASARAAFNEAVAARQASKAKTQELGVSAQALRDQAADLVRQIKAFAELQESPGLVYAGAQIPMPLEPSPPPAPGVPENIKVSLESTGAVTLSWTARNAAASGGVFYTISRKLPGQTGFVPIGGAPGTTTSARVMSFTDHTLPAPSPSAPTPPSATSAASGAQYIIQGRRGERHGEPSTAIVVQFGVGGVGGGGADGGSSAGVRTGAAPMRAAA